EGTAIGELPKKERISLEEAHVDSYFTTLTNQSQDVDSLSVKTRVGRSMTLKRSATEPGERPTEFQSTDRAFEHLSELI
ncbi:MAG: hypothetical protein RID07_00175, partial [Lacipirellulaceae bacterium]